VDAVVLRCLEFDREKRYATVSEFMSALTAAAGGEQVVDLRQLVNETRERAKSLNQWGSESTAVSDEPQPVVAEVPSRAVDGAGRGSGLVSDENAPVAPTPAPRAAASPPPATPRQPPSASGESTLVPRPVDSATHKPRIKPLESSYSFDCSLVPEGDAFLLKPKETTFGRVAQNDIVLLSPAVSRYHGRFIVTGNECVVEDYGSSNGIRVNGEAVHDRRTLFDEDVVEAGDVRFRYLA
jgi:hypothetical protein